MIYNASISQQTSNDEPELSIVIPAYFEEGNLEKIYLELHGVLSALNLSWEIIFSDDGSKDKTWQGIELLHQKDSRVKGIRLSRNFGHQYALFAGLAQAKGKGVISMDADLQHPPEVIPELVAEWQKGSRIVYTIRMDQKNITFFKKTTSRLFYKLLSFLSGVNLQSGMADFRLMDRLVVNSILQLPEEGLFLRGLVQWVGYPASSVKFQCRDRFSGVSRYTLKKMVKLAWTGITSFSIVPLRIGIFLGIITSVVAFGELTYAVYARLFTSSAVPGWASAVSILSFLFGILFILVGLLGEYIGRILIEVRRRPRFLISEQVGISNPTSDDSIRHRP
jgi:dolichol-phosphate mannosyltransferase